MLNSASLCCMGEMDRYIYIFCVCNMVDAIVDVVVLRLTWDSLMLEFGP